MRVTVSSSFRIKGRHIFFIVSLVSLLALLTLHDHQAYSNIESDVSMVLPPSFQTHSQTKALPINVVPIDVQTLSVRYHIDCKTKQATATAEMSFVPVADGYPMFDLVSPEIKDVTLNRAALRPDALMDMKDPDSKTRFLVLSERVTSKQLYRLRLRYRVKPSHIRFKKSPRVRNFFFWMTDNEGRERGFLEQYAPANFEGDQFRLTIAMQLHGCQGPHYIVSNAESTTEVEKHKRWVIRFPAYFNSSSPFLHLFSEHHHFTNFSVPSGDKRIPVVVYGKRRSIVANATRRIKRYFRLYEKRFGAYAHANLVVRVFARERYRHSMEYAGAIVATHLGALRHEMSHMWFGRGIFPANGNAGWLDEAVATWSECNFCSFEWLRKKKKFTRLRNRRYAPKTLSCGSGYRRTTIWNSYEYGMRALVEMDYMLRRKGQPGMLPLLKTFYQRNRRRIVTAEEIYRFFWRHESLRWYFQRFVMGNRTYHQCFRKPPQKKL